MIDRLATARVPEAPGARSEQERSHLDEVSAFLGKILPEGEGILLLAHQPQQGGMHHLPFTDLRMMAQKAIELDAQEASVYHACAVFEKGHRRTAANAVGANSFILDIDCGPGKPYPDTAAAYEALAVFVESCALPDPLVVHSGGGLHCYWPLTAMAGKTKWLATAAALKALTHCAAVRLHADDSRTADIASLLRPVGTHNRKPAYAGPVVSVVHDAEPVSYEAFASAVKAALARFGGRDTTGAQEALTGTKYAPPDTLPEGQRNTGVLAYIGHVRGSGMPESLLADAVHDFNTSRCVPPYPREKVDDLISRYAHQSHLMTEVPGEEWPEPQEIKALLPPVPAFDLGMLPGAFMPFVKDVSERMGQPADFIGVPLMIAAAAALGSSWAIAPKKLDTGWQESAVLWGGLIARPGTKKSACIDLALKPIRQIEADLEADYRQAVANFQTAKALFDAKSKNSKVATSGVFSMPEPQRERVLVQDTTYQKLAEVMSQSPKGLLCCADELAGLMNAWETTGQEAARAFYLTAWNGNQPYTVDRIGRGSNRIERAFACLLGGVQPSVLAEYIKQATRGGPQDDGLVQRFQMLTYPDFDPEVLDIDRPVDKRAEQAMCRAIRGLRDLSPARIGEGCFVENGRVVMQFDSAAAEHFQQLRRKIEQKAGSAATERAMASHLAKMPAVVAKIAMLIHLLDCGQGAVGVPALTKAIRWSLYLRQHAKRIYASADTARAQSAKTLADRIAEGKLGREFTAYTVSRKGWSDLRDDSAVRDATAWLVDAGWLKPAERKTGGRPAVVYVVNPKVNVAACLG